VTPATDALDRLTAALEGLAASLESGRHEQVLAAEAPLATAVHALGTCDLAALARRPDLRTAARQVRLAMLRCQTLGASAAAVAAAFAPAGYGATGRRARLSTTSTVLART
jgi:hypothetical protein